MQDNLIQVGIEKGDKTFETGLLEEFNYNKVRIKTTCPKSVRLSIKK